MSRVVEIPAFFDDKGFEQFAHSFSAGPITDRMLFDARGAQWASPYGLIGMLTAGQAVKEAGGPPPAFAVPEADEVRRYWVRAGFFGPAAELFDLLQECSDGLLELEGVHGHDGQVTAV